MANQTASSPFFARSYGGYTKDQFDFAECVMANYPSGILLDPMAGQAREMGRLAMAGRDIIVEDVNPACLCLAALRSPQLARNADELIRLYLGKLSTIRLGLVSETEFACDEWLTPSARSFIQKYRQHFRLNDDTTPFQEGCAYWMGDQLKVFATSMLVLVARQFICHRPSKNATWVKKGGVIIRQDLKKLLREFVARWRQSITENGGTDSKAGISDLVISTAISDSTLSGEPNKRVIGVITSPPYANRLDYAVMWAPELAVLCEIFSEDYDKIKRSQIGTTVVRGLKDDEGKLPESALRFLLEVRSGKAKASESYYLPFFKNYLLSLSRKIVSAASFVENGGFFVCFIRDCIRKDAKLDAEQFVASLLAESGFSYVGAGGAKKLVIRHHVGLRRPVDKGAVHGTAQTEWHLHFRKQ